MYSALLLLISSKASAQTDLPANDKVGTGVSTTNDNVYEIDGDNFGDVNSGANYDSWLLFGKVMGSNSAAGSNAWDNQTQHRIGFISTTDTYTDWYPYVNKHAGAKVFQGMYFGYVNTPNADDPSKRTRTNLMSITKDGNVGIGIGNPNTPLFLAPNIKGNVFVARFTQNNDDYAAGRTTFLGLGTERAFWSKAAIGFQRTSNYDVGDITFNVNKDATGGSDVSVTDEKMRIVSTGNVGIGTSTPSTKLQIAGTYTRTSAPNKLTSTDGSPILKFRSSLLVTNTSSSTSQSYDGQFGMSTWGDASKDYPFLNIETLQGSVPIVMEVGDQPIMELFQNQVLIGANLPFPSSDAVIPFSGLNYTLGVKGRVVSSSMTCKDITTWADHVFNDDYKLMPIEEVAAYISKNKHLPDVPSATEVKDAGIDVTEMFKIQMQKIEELTLYNIQLQKQLNALQAQVNKTDAVKVVTQ